MRKEMDIYLSGLYKVLYTVRLHIRALYGLSPDFRLRVLASSRSMMLAPS